MKRIMHLGWILLAVLIAMTGCSSNTNLEEIIATDPGTSQPTPITVTVTDIDSARSALNNSSVDIVYLDNVVADSTGLTLGSSASDKIVSGSIEFNSTGRSRSTDLAAITIEGSNIRITDLDVKINVASFDSVFKINGSNPVQLNNVTINASEAVATGISVEIGVSRLAITGLNITGSGSVTSAILIDGTIQNASEAANSWAEANNVDVAYGDNKYSSKGVEINQTNFADFANGKLGTKGVLTGDITLESVLEVTKGGFELDGDYHKITTAGADVYKNSSAIIINASDVVIKNLTIDASSSSSGAFAMLIGCGLGTKANDEDIPENIRLSNIEIETGDKASGINIHTANNVTVEGITVDSGCRRAAISVSSSRVLFDGAFSIIGAEWYPNHSAIQVNGEGGTPDHKPSTIVVADGATGIDRVWQEYVGADYLEASTFENAETFYSDSTQSDITVPSSWENSPLIEYIDTTKLKGWNWYAENPS